MNEFNLAKKFTAHEQSLNNIARARLQRWLDPYRNKTVSNVLVGEARHIASESRIKMARHFAMVTVFLI